ncbi:uncharacterized protein LOC133886577 isoform X2 [Phragmites australis]|uniref:uncharacterized protein LOC133886577 isoform X2 n=1 Tax=Phragmites australis TaxID=29695 RepID=UPI002D7725BE|nr:uncharacterized protein LOC133886577 isoform X2 [Phragmites australis]XP_062182237.1 uncharacterized protein LOC133886577 isoform X2 [Phragmites australis]
MVIAFRGGKVGGGNSHWNSAAPSSLPLEHLGKGEYGMAGLINLRASLGNLLSAHWSSSVRQSPASQVTVQFSYPLSRSAKLCRTRSLVAPALKVSKDGSLPGLANRQPSKARSAWMRASTSLLIFVGQGKLLLGGQRRL